MLKGREGTTSFEKACGTLKCHSEGGGTPFNGGMQKVLPCVEKGRRKGFWTQFSHCVASLPEINDQSLS